MACALGEDGEMEVLGGASCFFSFSHFALHSQKLPVAMATIDSLEIFDDQNGEGTLPCHGHHPRPNMQQTNQPKAGTQTPDFDCMPSQDMRPALFRSAGTNLVSFS